ncbi:hypothetical protein HP436_08785 [Pseudomonas sp. CrR14]|nr:hypothetical protein [Pseudomonas sp. CrR14]
MQGRFARVMDRLHRVGSARLADSTAKYLSARGETLADDLPIQLDRNVDPMEFGIGAVGRVTTVTVRKALLVPFDRKASFVVAGEQWHITKDGIAADDGHMITLYVEPE